MSNSKNVHYLQTSFQKVTCPSKLFTYSATESSKGHLGIEKVVQPLLMFKVTLIHECTRIFLCLLLRSGRKTVLETIYKQFFGYEKPVKKGYMIVALTELHINPFLEGYDGN